jgi:hypothetical protein
MVIVGDIAGWLELKDIRPGAGSVITVPDGSVCFPTCTSNDARFISLAGTGLETLAGDRVHLEFAAAPDATALEIGIFDGETSGVWDLGTAPLEYTLYADPNADGTGTIQVGQWLGNNMIDDNWYLINVNTSADAKADSGYYFYRMVVRNTGATTTTWSNFKVRTNGYLLLKPGLAAFAFTASMQPSAGSIGPIIYSGWPSTSNTTYDGTWNFYMDVPEETTEVVIWDGDFDYGDYTCTNNDGDDANTPNDLLPDWAAGTQAVFEGVGSTTLTCRDAAGNITTGLMTGNPPDDAKNINLLRAPATIYQITAPDGRIYANTNPSGNREWEQFSVDSDASAAADHLVAQALSGGLYHIQVSGMDLNNLNAWRFDYDIMGVCPDGTPCKLFPKTKLGDYVWVDENEDGIQDPDEPGIPNVSVDLRDTSGNTLETHTTDTTGFYETFQVPAGTYNVTVNTNTLPPDLNQTYDLDGVNTPHTADVTVENNLPNLDVDFGYVPQEEVLVCEVQIAHPDFPNDPDSGGFFYAQVDPDTGDVYIRYTQSLDVNDNTYGAGQVNWPTMNHDWKKLHKSDQTRFEITDANGNVVVDLYMDYIDEDPTAPHGFRSEGPTGGDGQMVVGDVNWIYDWTSSAQVNLERFCTGTNCTVNGVNLVVDSPPTVNHQSYELVDPAFSDYIFPYWIEFHVKAAAFGNSTFGGVELTDIHNSNAKHGNDQFCVGGGCGICVPALGQPLDFNPPTAPLPPAETTDNPPVINPESRVSSITATTANAQGNKWTATVTILVVDEFNGPIANALVSGTWSEGGNGTVTCTTNASGQCSITSDKINKNRNTTIFTVTAVTHSAYTYQPATSTDTITVNKP